MNLNNNAQITNFKFFLPFLGDEVQYAQNIMLPGLTINPINAYNGGKKALVGGDSIEFTPITITFMVDEKFSVYKKIVDFFFKKVHPNNGILDDNLGDFTAGIEVTDNLGNPLLAIEMYGCKLNDLANIMLASNNEDNEIMLDLTFSFDQMEIVDYLDAKRILDFKSL